MRKESLVGFNLRLPINLKKKLTKQAAEQKRSLNKHVVHILENEIASKVIDKTSTAATATN